MSPEDQKIAIAESVGLPEVKLERWCGCGNDLKATYSAPGQDGKGGNTCRTLCHDYLNDLNAMHTVIAELPSDGSWGLFLTRLARITGGFDQPDTTRDMLLVQATAAQRAEAYLRTIGKWKD